MAQTHLVPRASWSIKDKVAVKNTSLCFYGTEFVNHSTFMKYIITPSLGGLMPNAGSLWLVFDQLFSSLALSRVLKKIHSGL